MKSIDLSPFKNQRESEELQEYDLGQSVEVPDGEGIIAAFAESDFEYPVGSADRIERIEEEEEIEQDEMETIEASEDNPIYIVSLLDGGSVAVSPEEIDGINELPGDGKDVESPEDVEKTGDEAEMSPVYEYCDDPSSRAELEEAKRKYIHENYAEELGEYVGEKKTTLAALEEMPVEELVNIRGVDDPHVGFDELPPGWTRKSVLQAWASVGGMWRTLLSEDGSCPWTKLCETLVFGA